MLTLPTDDARLTLRQQRGNDLYLADGQGPNCLIVMAFLARGVVELVIHRHSAREAKVNMAHFSLQVSDNATSQQVSAPVSQTAEARLERSIGASFDHQ